MIEGYLKNKNLILTIIFILAIVSSFNIGFILGSKIFKEVPILVNCP